MFEFFKKKKIKTETKEQKNENIKTKAGNDKANTDDLVGNRNEIKQIIAVISGKGGVGKSTVSGLLASGLIMRGYRVGILDADITGPSIPKMFGLSGGKMGKNDYGIVPRRSRMGLKIMSLNLFIPDETDPVIWRGPRIGSAVGEFYSQVDWGKLDFLILDMPPGTGDIAISVLQNISLSGAIVVTTPQDMAFTIVRKAYNMLVNHQIPVLGIVENLKAGICPNCQKEFALFTDMGIEQWCSENQVDYLGGIPWDRELALCADQGNLEDYYPGHVDRMLDCFISTTISRI